VVETVETCEAAAVDRDRVPERDVLEDSVVAAIVIRIRVALVLDRGDGASSSTMPVNISAPSLGVIRDPDVGLGAGCRPWSRR
jgi:hypothetical protein